MTLFTVTRQFLGSPASPTTTQDSTRHDDHADVDDVSIQCPTSIHRQRISNWDISATPNKRPASHSKSSLSINVHKSADCTIIGFTINGQTDGMEMAREKEEVR